MKPPCHNCNNRHPCCHDGFSAYQAYKNHRQAISDKRQEINSVRDYFRETSRRSEKIRRQHA